jgi:tetratricopeptide (TPR) repeat protein
MINEIQAEIEKEEFTAIFALGANFFSQGQFRKAQVIFAGLMVLDSKSEEAFIAYGESLIMAGDASKAMHHFLKAKKRFNNRAIDIGIAKAAILLKRTREDVN